jgi:branched-chain amino acid transport system substrate-binding protein
MRQRTFLLLFLVLSACSTSSSGFYGYQPGAGGPSLLGPNAPAPQVPPGSRIAVAILTPMTGSRADIGQALVQAAQLALQQDNSPSLDVLDTTGTPQGAAAAAQTAIAHGDGMILGPLTSGETAAVTPIAKRANVPVLAFTNDGARAQPGIWPLGVTPGEQVRRLVAAGQVQGKTRFAALLPGNDFGHAMAAALTEATTAADLPVPRIQFHGQGMQSLTAATREVTDYAHRRGPIAAKIKADRESGTPEARREAQELAKAPIPPPPFDALLLADTGDTLLAIPDLLSYYDVDRSGAQFMGPSLWADPATGSLAVAGAWYAAPDPNARSAFVQSYSAKYGVPPPSIADLAFDAASVARVSAPQRGSTQNMLTQQGGFIGADGWFSLQPDGKVQRGLAVFKIERGGNEVVDPAPQSAGSPGF